MLNHLIDFSLRQKFVALSLVLLMAFGGIAALRDLPINSLPDVTPVQVLVITKAGRYSPFDVERLVSFPIETTMNGLPDVKEVRSISQFGLSAVTIEFEESTDIYFARQMVSQRLQSVTDELPDGVSTPQLGPISTALGEIYQYIVRGENQSLTELRTIQDWLIAPQLKTIKGVTEITAFGGFVKQYEVIITPGQLRAYNIGFGDIIDAIANNNSVSGGNYLEHNREQYIIRGFGLIRNQADIENVVVTKLGNRPVYVRDVAEVRIGEQLRQGAVTQDGKGEFVTGIVMMLRGGNGRVVIQDIEAKIEEVNKGLPAGVQIEKFYDQSDLVERTTSTIQTNLLEGGFFVIAVLLLMLGEITGALIVASVIPLSMLFAFIGMREFGLAANLMSLGAIDFGMVVDGSVVMIENMVHRMEKEGNSRPTILVLREAAHEVSRPIFFGVLIILMVYVPIATFSGMEGILFRPMAITVATAVFGSLLLALVYVPAVAAIVFRKGVKVRRNYVMEWMQPRYRRFLEKNLDRKTPTFVIAFVLFGAALALLPFLGTEFLPELDEGSILVEQVRMPSVTLNESVENANWFAGQLMAHVPEIETVVPKTGRSDLANDWMGVHQTDVWVLLKPREDWRPGMTKERIIEEIRPYLTTEPGLSYNFTQPIAMRVDELTSGVKSDVAVKVFGEDLAVLQQVGDDIARILPSLPGTDNFFVEQTVGQPYLNIDIDRQAVASYGLNVNEVQQIIEAGIGGLAVSQVFEGQRRFDIVARYPADIRSSFRDIMNVPVQLPNGDYIPLDRVATIQAEEGPGEIARENGRRRIIVGINLKDIDIGTYVATLQEAIETQLAIPAGNFVEYGGAFEEQQRAMRHLFVVVPLALFIILGLLYLMFGQMRYAWMIFLNLPFALSGGIFLLWARGLYLSVSASIGFVALFGVAVLNGIVLVEHLNALRREGLSVREATITGSVNRLRPVLMTALVASLGFIPMAFNVGPGSEVQRPLATVVIGGLLTATILTLRVLPTIYNWLEKDSHIPGKEEVFDTVGIASPSLVPPPLLVLLLCLAFVVAQPAAAQPDQLSVYDAIALAEVQSPLLNRLRAQLEGQEGLRLTAFGLQAPEVRYGREGIRSMPGPDYAEQRWVLTQTVDFPLQSYYRLRRIGTEGDALAAQLEAERALLRARVKRSYTGLVYAQELVHLRRQEVQLGNALLQAVITRVEVGEAAELDQMKVEIQLAEAQSNLEEAERTFHQERYALFNVIGLDPEDQRYGIQFPDTLIYFNADIDQEDVLASLGQQPELRSADLRLDAARLGIKQNKSAVLPRMMISYFPQDFGTGYNAHGFEVGFSLPVWFFLNNRGEVRQARAEAQQRSWERQAVYLDLKKQVEQVWHGYETSQRTIQRFNEVVQARADELLRLTQEGYELGELDLLTLLDTQRTYLSSQQRYYNALRDYYNDLIDLERFVGRDLVFRR